MAPIGCPDWVTHPDNLPNHRHRHTSRRQGNASARQSAHIIVLATKSLPPSQTTVEIVKETGYSEKLVRDIVRKIDLNEYKRK